MADLPPGSMLGRRELIAASFIGIGLAAAAPATACSLTATRNTPFSDRACRRELAWFVKLLNEGPGMTLDQIAGQVDESSVEVDQELIDEILGDTDDSQTDRNYLFFKRFKLSAEKLDPKPVRLSEVNLIRQLRSRAAYQFTLDRYSYHPADEEGCNGLFTHGEYYGVDRTSYLATFQYNRLQGVRLFPEWYLEERA